MRDATVVTAGAFESLLRSDTTIREVEHVLGEPRLSGGTMDVAAVDLPRFDYVLAIDRHAPVLVSFWFRETRLESVQLRDPKTLKNVQKLFPVARGVRANPPVVTSEAMNSQESKALIESVLETQAAAVLTSEIAERLRKELERPFAIGGKSGLYPPSPRDLSTGWELFVEKGSMKADVEFTVGDIDKGAAQQVVVTVVAPGDASGAPRLSVTVTPVGKPSSVDELRRAALDEKSLRELGVMSEKAGVTSIRFSVSQVIWPYPVSIEVPNDAGLVESRSKTASLVVVASEDLKRFAKKGDGLVTAFVSFLGREKAPHSGDRYVAQFRTSELWKVNLPLNPAEPPASFVILEEASSLQKAGTK